MRISPLLVALAVAAAQTPPTIRVDVNLIQVDATVTDGAGKRVPDLTAADFEISRNGKRQEIKNVLWVPGQRVNQPAVAERRDSKAAAGDMRPEDVRRTIVIVLDDFSLTLASVNYTQQALRTIVEESVGSRDLVAIYRTSSPRSLLQQFTTNKRELLASVNRMTARAGALGDTIAGGSSSALENSGDPALAARAQESQFQQDVNDRTLRDIRTAAMLGAVNLAVQGLRELPGRKSLVLLSESIQLMDLPVAFINPQMAALSQRPGGMGGKRDRTDTAARKLIDTANRAGVTIYTIDPRGLVVPGLTAQDDFRSPDPRQAAVFVGQRDTEMRLSQDGLSLLATETGGVFYKNTNDIAGALRDSLDDQEGYYLIAFQPDNESFEKLKGEPKLQRLSMKVKRPGTTVRYRRSFYGVAEETAQKPNPLANALLSPFRATAIPLKITPVFMQADKLGGMFRTLVHIDISGLRFTETPADAADKNQQPWRQAMLYEALVLFDENGKQVEQISDPQTIKFRGEGMERVLRDGLEQQIDIPVAKPGQYQVRAAVAEAGSGKAGSAAQFVEAPDLTSKRLALSGVMLASVAFGEKKDAAGSSSRRVVRKGGELDYALYVYNAIPQPAGGQPNLLTQLRLFRDGAAIFTGKKTPLGQEGRKEDGSVLFKGRMRVGAPPGDYLLEIAVQDVAAPAKQQAAVRYIDFTVRE